MTKIRKTHKNGFTVMDNGVFKSELSLKARGLLSTMMSLPDDWDFSERGLAVMLPKDGRDAVHTGLKELEDAGYLKRERIRDGKGKIMDCVYVFSDYPQLDNPYPENPAMDNPYPENPAMENPANNINKQVLNKKESNKNQSNTKQCKAHVGLDEVKQFFEEKQLTVSPDDFYHNMEMRMWRDASGELVNNWKGFAIAWNAKELQSKAQEERSAIAEKPTKKIPSVEWVMEHYKVTKDFAQGMIANGIY